MSLLQRLCWTVLFCLLRFSSTGAENITAAVGENVTLTCKVLNNNISVTFVEWTRLDLDTHQVIVYRNKKFDPDSQHPSFQNRVDLLDLQKGDVSLILKNLKMNDSGTYECHVDQERTNTGMNPITTIILSVVPSGDKDEVKEEEEHSRSHSGTHWTVALVVLAAGVFLILKRRQKNSSSRPDGPADVEMNPLNHDDSSIQPVPS